MKLLYGTTNIAKVEHMREMIKSMNIDIISLDEINKDIPKIEEDGRTPLENARKKAQAYYEEFKMPVFTCDSGLYLDEVEDFEQPGVNVRRIKGKEFSDNEMINYYSKIAREKGGEIIAQYENAICLIIDEENIFEYQGHEISSDKFIIADKACDIKRKGFPLDSLSKEIKSRKYYFELEDYEEDKSRMAEGFKNFFRRSIPHE